MAGPLGSEARKIRARLFYVAEDGLRLSPVEQEVIYGEGTVEQAKRLIEAQLAAVAAGLSSYNLPALRSAAEALVTVMRDHMAHEESLLYPQLRARLTSTVVRSISRQIAARRARPRG